MSGAGGFFDNLYYRLSLFTTVGWQGAIFSTANAISCGLASYSFSKGNPVITLGGSLACGIGTTLAFALTDTAALYYFPVDVPSSNITQTTATISPNPSSSYLPDNNYPDEFPSSFPTASASPIPLYSTSPYYSAEPTVTGATATPAPGFSAEIEN